MIFKELEKLPTKKLILKAYHEEDDDIYINYIHILRTRGNEEVFKLTKQLVYSKDSVFRDIAASILGQFGYKTKLHKGESVYLLNKLLNDKNEDVITSAIYAFGHRKCSRYAEKLASFITLNSKQVNEALAFTLGHYTHKKAIETLILLMKNKDFDTRNWATFELAQISEVNTPKICDALFNNLSDKEFEVRGEALLGLALRKDIRVKAAILEDFQADFYGSWIFDAIIEMPDREYIQYFDTYVNSLHEDDIKAFKSNIEGARQALKEFQ